MTTETSPLATSDVDEIRFRETEEHTDPGFYRPPGMPDGEREHDRSPLVWIAAIVLGLALGGAVAMWWFLSRDEPVVAEPPPATEAPAPVAEPAAVEPTVPMPPLDQSDALVRELVARLSAHPQLARWLVNDELVRRAARVVGNIAWGEDPRAHLPFLRPNAPFRATREGGSTVVDPRSYARYDLAADVFTSIDTAGAVALYRQLRPLLAEAYAELGYPDTWDDAVRNAVRVVLATPPVPQVVELERGVVSYHFLEPELEELADAQKLLLRTGPRNAERIEAKVRELASAAGIPY